MPKMCWPQPHWNIATWAPSAAAIESRKPRIDVIGTRIVRKANVSRMNAKPMTTSRKIGRALDSLAETSILDAVVPPTKMCAPVLPSMAARSLRKVCTRAAVAGSFVRTWRHPDQRYAVLSHHRGHLRTSRILVRAAAICWVSAGLRRAWATISSGPLKPAPSLRW